MVIVKALVGISCLFLILVVVCSLAFLAAYYAGQTEDDEKNGESIDKY